MEQGFVKDFNYSVSRIKVRIIGVWMRRWKVSALPEWKKNGTRDNITK